MLSNRDDDAGMLAQVRPAPGGSGAESRRYAPDSTVRPRSWKEWPMGITVSLCAWSLHYPLGGGHRWVYLNWALGLRALGCEVYWLEVISPGASAQQIVSDAMALKESLQPFGLSDRIVLLSPPGCQLPTDLSGCFFGLDTATDADLLLNFRYSLPARIVARFSRSALVGIDPGLLQCWIASRQIDVARHDVYFTTGETVTREARLIPDCGLEWIYTPPCVDLDHWPVALADSTAPFTTISHWFDREWITLDGEIIENNKRAGFQPYLDLPRSSAHRLELALNFGDEEATERPALEARGWSIRRSHEVAPTLSDYQSYIQNARGEFSCAKPSCILFQNAWISDRTLCFLASGKPAIVQHTGPSRYLPDAAGLWRFRDLQGAVHAIDAVSADYEHQCHLARSLAEDYFDASKVVGRVLEVSLA